MVTQKEDLFQRLGELNSLLQQNLYQFKELRKKMRYDNKFSEESNKLGRNMLKDKMLFPQVIPFELPVYCIQNCKLNKEPLGDDMIQCDVVSFLLIPVANITVQQMVPH
jgi:hypothetical protein